MRMTPRHLLALGLLAALTFAACGGGGDDEEAGGDGTTTTAEAETTTESTPNTMSGGSGTTGPEDPDPSTTAAGELLPFSFTDDFSDDTGWLIGCNEGSGCSLVQDGRLAAALDSGAQEIDQHEQFASQILTNLTISTKLLDFSGEPEAGVVCHYDPEADTYYDFTIRGDGTGSVFKFVDGEGESVAPRFEVPLFTGGNELITATCTTEPDGGVRLTMEANFETVVDVVDSEDPLPPGQIGLVTYGESGRDTTVSFDDLDMEGEIYRE